VARAVRAAPCSGGRQPAPAQAPAASAVAAQLPPSKSLVDTQPFRMCNHLTPPSNTPVSLPPSLQQPGHSPGRRRQLSALLPLHRPRPLRRRVPNVVVAGGRRHPRRPLCRHAPGAPPACRCPHVLAGCRRAAAAPRVASSWPGCSSKSRWSWLHGQHVLTFCGTASCTAVPAPLHLRRFPAVRRRALQGLLRPGQHGAR
jgi:hypothetical protein